MILLKLVLALSTAHTSAASNSVIWPITWSLIADAGSVPVTRVQNGYGDWCTIAEGPHPGLDFTAAITDNVVNPSFQKCYSLGYGTESHPQEHILVLGDTTSDDYGWTLGHLYCLEPWYDWNPNSPSTVLDWNSGDSISFCGLDVSQPGPWRHLHLSWVEDWVHPPPVGYSVPGYTNPFDHIVADLTGYDEVQFKQVLYEKEFMMPDTYTGTWFMPDETETAGQISGAPGSPDYAEFQNIVSGAIDIAVSPFSAFQGISDYDSAGVYSISYEILRQNPINLNYFPAAPDTGNFGERFLMQMCDELPFGDTDEFRAIYLDGNLPNNTASLQQWDRFESAYIVTNSGALDPANWTTGWDNVWIKTGEDSSCINDWETGICQGAWDTFLAKPEIVGDPSQNSEAFFPDGRYAVKVTAVSHASRDTVSMRLPLDDLSLPDPQIEGVVVDNFLPHIVRVAVYAWNPVADTCFKKYAGYWEDIDPNRAMAGESKYLEKLREQLSFFQTREASISGSEIPVPQRLSSEEHSVLSINHSHESVPEILQERDSRQDYSNIEIGCCLDEEKGQDPVDFLLEEIARVETQQILCDIDTSRTFIERTYRYLPDPGQHLILQVFYSEPIMIENSDGQTITDKLYFRGIIGDSTHWFSPKYGRFERLPGNIRLPLTSDNTASNEMESGNAFFDSSNVVLYIFKGALPQHYVGNIQLYFGGTELQVDEGPRDLAGNTIDSYPGTTAEARNSYGPFSYIGFGGGPDTNYSWDPPDWCHNTSTDIVYGTVGIEKELVAAVDLNSIGLEDAIFIGDCDYWCGFWMYRDVPDVCGFNVYVVKHNGSFIDHSFSTPYPVGGIHYQQNWFSNLGDLSDDTRYFWMTGNTMDLISSYQSTAFAYCVDSETGATITYEVCTGWCFYGPRCLSNNLHNEDYQTLIDEMFSTYASNAIVLDIDSFGVAQIMYTYFEVMGDTSSYVVDTTYLPPPDTIDVTFGYMFCESDICTDAEEVIEILSNPVRETLNVRLIGETGQDYELLLYDIAGRQILSESGVVRDDESVLSIGVENLPSGVYLLRIRSGSFETVRTISIVR